jgi:hypothetical protein
VVEGQSIVTQRYRPETPCPVCGGWSTQRRGQGVRCYGYFLADGTAAVCVRVVSRVEMAGGYLHRLDRACCCSAIHGQYVATPNPDWHARARATRSSHAWDWADVVKTSDYRMRDYDSGATVAVHRRYDLIDRSKDFHWYRHGTPGLKGLPEASIPLFRGYEVLHDEQADRPLVICEGEKAALAVERLGLHAVGISIGAPKVPNLVVLQPLAVRFELLLWPDNDEPGRQLAVNLGRVLHGRRIGLRILDWPDAPPKGDAADFVASGGTLERALALIVSAKPWIDMTIEAALRAEPPCPARTAVAEPPYPTTVTLLEMTV